MPSRYARNRFAALVAMVGAFTSMAHSQQLNFPSDSVGEAVVPPNPTVIQNDTSYRELVQPGAVGVVESGDVPFTAVGGGSYYNPNLGAHLRAQYRTRSYGQQEGTFSLGTMKLLDLGDSFGFLDGQVTLNDASGVGYNVGAGYRWYAAPIIPWSLDSQKIAGLSVWADGQTIDRDQFFPQVGVSFEMLGERTDFRVNGYIPVGAGSRDSNFVATGTPLFAGNTLTGGQTTFTRTESLATVEAEVAGRISNLDAWGFAGVYGFENGGDGDGVGGKIGLRGYATPDLLLSIALTNDDIFDTNAVFNATWFIGRTRAENVPVGTLADRFREPVLRNNYVTTRQRQIVQNDDPFNVNLVHVDSTAAAGGDGTFENPLNSFADLAANSGEGDTVLVHSDSVLIGSTAALQNGQTLIGEGGGTAVSLLIDGNAVELPETAVGALGGALPSLDGGAGAAITLANDNRVERFTIAGGTQAIDANGSNNPIIEAVTVNAGAGGFVFNNVTGAAQVASSSLTGTTTPAISFTGGTGTLSVDSLTTIADITGNAVVVNNNGGAVTINSNITTSAAVSGGTVDIDENQALVTIGGAIDANDVNALDVTNAGAEIVTNGTINHDGTGDAISLVDTVANSEVGISINGAVTNTGGRSVFVDGLNDVVSFNSTVSDTGAGIRIEDLAVTAANSGVVDFGGAVSVNTGTTPGDGVSLNNNDASSVVSFGVLNVTTSAGEGIVSNGGQLNVDGATSSITTDGETALRLVGGSSAQGLTFATVNAMSVTGDSAVVLDNFGGDVTINGGTINTVAGFDAVTVTNTDLTFGAGVTLDSGTTTAIDATYTTADNRTLNVSGDLSGDGVTVLSNSGAAANANTVALIGVTNFGDSTFTLDGAGDLTTNLVAVDGGGTVGVTSTLASTGDLTVDVSGSGSMDAIGAVTINDQGAGNLTVTSMNTTTGGAFDVTSTGAGDVSVTASSLNATGAIGIDSQGAGMLTASLTDSMTGATLDIASAGDTDADITVDNVAATGAITINETGSGDLNATVEGGTSTNSTLTITSAGMGNAMVTVDNVTADGGVTIDDQGAGDLTANTVNVTSGANLAFLTAGDGDANITIDGINATGAITANATNNGDFNVDVDDSSGGIAFDTTSLQLDAANTGDVTYTVNNLGFDTGGGTNGLVLLLGDNVENANVTVSNNNVTTGNAQAFNFDVGGATAVNFLLADNTFTNDSGPTRTAFVDIGGDSTLNTVDATIRDNDFFNVNAGATVDFEIARTVATAGTVNLNLFGNNAQRGTGVGQVDGALALTNDGPNLATDFLIFELADTQANTGNRNDVVPTFVPANFTNSPTAPTLPTP